MWAAAAVTVAAAAVVCAVAFTRTGRCLLEVVLFRCVHYLPRREVLNTSRSTVRHHPVGGRGVGDDDDSVAQDGGAGGAYSKQAAGNVRDAALAVHAKFVDANGSVDYEGLSMSAELDKLILAAAALERCDLTALTPVELKCCMLNVYNALYMHAAIALRPAGMIQKLWLFQSASYVIGGHALSLDEIENGILRGNRLGPMSIHPMFSPDDPRLPLAIPDDVVDPRIHFALNCGAVSCPTVAVYSVESLEKELEDAAHRFVAQNVVVQEDEEEFVVHVSEIFLWYRRDFAMPGEGEDADSDIALLRGVYRHMPAPWESDDGAALHRVIRSVAATRKRRNIQAPPTPSPSSEAHDASGDRKRLRVEKLPYDWSPNATPRGR